MTEEIIKRTYVIPLRRGFFNTPRYKRTNKAVTVLKNFLVKHMKTEDVKLGKHLNEFLWKNGIKNPPAKVKVEVTKDKEGRVRAELVGKEYVDFKMQEKVDKNQSFKEKIKSKVTDAKEPVKTETKKPLKSKKEVQNSKATSTSEKSDKVKSTAKAETKPAEVKAEKTAAVAKKPVETKPAEKVESKPVKEDKSKEE